MRPAFNGRRLTPKLSRYQPSPSSITSPVARVRLSEQDIEVIHSGDNNFVRLSDQYIETIHAGDNNYVRLSDQYIEVIHEYGAPPAPRGFSWGYIIG